MTARYLGSLSIGQAIPGASVLVSAGLAGITAALPELQGKLDGLLSFKPGPISITAQIGQLQTQIAALQLQVSLGLPPPTMAVQLANIEAQLLSVRASIGQLELQKTLIAELQAVLVTAGLHAVSFSGRADRLGVETGGVLSAVPGISPADATQAITLATTVPAVFAALSKLLKVG